MASVNASICVRTTVLSIYCQCISCVFLSALFIISFYFGQKRLFRFLESRFSFNGVFDKILRVNNKQTSNLAKFFYDIAKIDFAALVIAQLANPSDSKYWILIVGTIATIRGQFDHSFYLSLLLPPPLFSCLEISLSQAQAFPFATAQTVLLFLRIALLS